MLIRYFSNLRDYQTIGYCRFEFELLSTAANAIDSAAMANTGRYTARNPSSIIVLSLTAMMLTAPAGGCVIPIRPSAAIATAGATAFATHRGIPPVAPKPPLPSSR